MAVLTDGAGASAALRDALRERGLPLVAVEPMPLLPA